MNCASSSHILCDFPYLLPGMNKLTRLVFRDIKMNSEECKRKLEFFWNNNCRYFISPRRLEKYILNSTRWFLNDVLGFHTVHYKAVLEEKQQKAQIICIFSIYSTYVFWSLLTIMRVPFCGQVRTHLTATRYTRCYRGILKHFNKTF
jgi:hypothetical protein